MSDKQLWSSRRPGTPATADELRVFGNEGGRLHIIASSCACQHGWFVEEHEATELFNALERHAWSLDPEPAPPAPRERSSGERGCGLALLGCAAALALLVLASAKGCAMVAEAWRPRAESHP